MPRLVLTLLLGLAAAGPAFAQSKPAKTRATVTLKAKDGLEITADHYPGPKASKGSILLCHQARSSRGEYRAIAPKLQQAGYTCLALDQRSGKAWGGVKNETAARAAAAKKATGYLDALPDLEAGIAWLKKRGAKTVILWGSSYSASLVLVLASRRKDVQAVFAFSPGEYFKRRDTVGSAAAKIRNTHVFLAAPQRERSQVTDVRKALHTSNTCHLITDPKMRHGASTLVKSSFAKELWSKHVLPFLKKQAKPLSPKGKSSR